MSLQIKIESYQAFNLLVVFILFRYMDNEYACQSIIKLRNMEFKAR